MLIGVPKEIKNHEYRVGLTPASVRECVDHGHTVFVQTQAGMGIDCSDDDYRHAGATLLATAEEVFEKSELIVKVKEPQLHECRMLKKHQTLFTYLHLAADLEQTKALMESGCVAIAYETVTDDHGGLPLLAPMSQVAGRMAIQAGAHALEKAQGGRGILLGGVPGVAPAKVVVIGGGMVGTHAIQIALGMGADVTVLDRSEQRLQELYTTFGAKLKTVHSTAHAIESCVSKADLVVGAVLIPGAAAPKLITRDILRKMHPASVFVDVAIDQGGSAETSKPTTHQNPTYVEEGVIHYCVTNMPGAVPRTATFALNNATLKHVLALADLGYEAAMRENPHLARGLNIFHSTCVHEEVANALSLPYKKMEFV